jgi:DNA-directed RNA polymerase specialized sigma24 family protein
MIPPGDDELPAAAALGDGAGFAVLYRRQIASILALLRRRVDSEEVAADLASKTCAAVLLACRRYLRSNGRN